MITRSNGSKWGIKNSGVNFTHEIHSLIDNANNYIVVCGYNFSPYNNATSIIPKLIAKRSAGVEVLFIAPPTMWGFGNTRHTGNIQHLLNNNIGVILNSNNHSKWMLSDYGYYYGSLNFTASSMKNKVEVVSFCDTLNRPRRAIPQWMSETRTELLDFAISELNNFNTNVATKNLGTVNSNSLIALNNALTSILRYNPSIKKIETTLDNYEEVRMALSSIIDNYFPLVSFKSLNFIWTKINNILYHLDGLAYLGNDIILRAMKEASNLINLRNYNRRHERFIASVKEFLSFIENNKFDIDKEVSRLKLTTSTEIILNGFKTQNDQNLNDFDLPF